MSTLQISHSYSRLSSFETCPKQYEYLYVLDSKIVNEGNEVTEYGIRVHSSLELYGKSRDERHITQETRTYKSLVDTILSQSGNKFFELKLSVDRDAKPCEWTCQTVWVRSIIDVLVLDKNKAYCIDWKTGKPRDNPMQLQLFACMIMFHYPEVEEVKTSFVWLHHGFTSDAKYKRKNLSMLWDGLCARFARVENAVKSGVFEAKPGPLCKKWCAARKACAHGQAV